MNPAKHPHVKKELGQQFIDWLISHEGQQAIANYKIGGEQVFWPQREVIEQVKQYSCWRLLEALL